MFDREAARLHATDESSRAELAGVDRTTLWRWRHGKQTPSLEKATDIAARFGISVEDLIERAAA